MSQQQAVPPTNGNKQKPTILQYLERYKDQVAAALPSHVTADRMVRIVTTSIRKNPDLVQCNPQSLFGAIIQTSQLGLEVDNSLGHAYFVPFRNTRQKTKDVQLIIGYRGFIELAWRSGKVVGIDAEVVYEKDRFRYTKGLNPTLEHIYHEGSDKGERTHAYCIFHLRDGGKVWRVLTREDVMKAKDFSAAGNSGPWKTHEDDMWRKTAVRATAKYAPLSIQLQTAVGVDEQYEAGKVDSRNIFDGEFMEIPTAPAAADDDAPPKSKTEQLRDKVTTGAGNGNGGDTPPEADAAGAENEPQQADLAGGPPTEAEVFAQLDEVLAEPGKYSRDTINEIAAISDAVSDDRAHEFQDKLKKAQAAITGGRKKASAK